jgi:hypothetical protein
VTTSFCSISLPLAMLIACRGHDSGAALTPALHGFAFPCSEQTSDEGIAIRETFGSQLWTEASRDGHMRSLTMVAGARDVDDARSTARDTDLARHGRPSGASFRASVRALGSAADGSGRDELAGDGAKLALAVEPHVGALTDYTLQLSW